MDVKQSVIARESGKAGFRGKINAKCAECIYDPIGKGTWREQVENCASTACALYSVRPISSKKD